MKQILIFIMFIAFSKFSFACAMPISGEKYDALIEIEKVETGFHTNEYGYIVKFPTVVEKQKLHFALLYIINPNDKEFNNHIRVPLDIKKEGEYFHGFVAARGKLESKITIGVQWGKGGICPIGASATIKHNNSSSR